MRVNGNKFEFDSYEEYERYQRSIRVTSDFIRQQPLLRTFFEIIGDLILPIINKANALPEPERGEYVRRMVALTENTDKTGFYDEIYSAKRTHPRQPYQKIK